MYCTIVQERVTVVISFTLMQKKITLLSILSLVNGTHSEDNHINLIHINISSFFEFFIQQ